ncbi:leucyl aminopeptidase [Evansella cellulosilytica]|uniref:Probable cytosol aminopeptidase n=1 Tax=Evansella cellulosilytica (strain ATCC 21833 / DSM 2522 / FERM P-1141 / JCM 9156 / N-4) TaxID=649639 RepID=E6TXJ7_EVAC2|nr:leucyl aminopeptidase [Evansella cellulosilytica]ADU28811.1 peptidase M17 leucyl aminopeptidase domain protein [Evansella cellulosilytica DSM 2522]
MYQFIQENILNYETEAILYGVFQEESSSFHPFEEAFSNELSNLIELGELSPEAGHVCKLHPFNKAKARRIYFVGLGYKADITKDGIRKAFSKAFKQLAKDKVSNIALALDSLVQLPMSDTDAFEAIGEAQALAPFQLNTYHTKKLETTKLKEFTIIAERNHREKEVVDALKVGFALGEGANVARNLVNAPGNLMNATHLADYAKSLAEKHKLEIDILEKEDMEQLQMGALLAVNQGSTERQKFIVIRYQGKETWEDPVAIIGKGITFDTGGYSLKGKDGIIGMKMDMGGAASTLGAVDVIGKLKPNANVMAVIPATDNMISGSAFKPDDVIFSMSGKTIEVRNTDEEGRLVLADAITYAKKEGASEIIDIATLTGGVVVALGNEVTGVMTNNEGLLADVQRAANETGELMWQLPYFDLYKKQVRTSHIADLNNSPGRAGHAIMAGVFVGEFAGSTPWVHIDIAGTAMASSEHELGPKGPTGVMTRTLAKFVMNKK